MSEARRTYTREFKVAAVKLVAEKGKSVSEAARSLGIAAELLRRTRLWGTSPQSSSRPHTHNNP